MADPCEALWENLLKGNKPIKPETQQRYRNLISMMETVCGVTLYKALGADAHAAIKGLRKHYTNAGTMASIATVLVSLYRHSPSFASRHKASHDRWRRFLAVTAHTYQMERDDNRVTDEIIAKTPTCAEIRKAMAKLKATGLTKLRDSQHYIMLAISVDNPPKRRDLGALQVMRRDLKATKGNYIVVPNAGGQVKLVLQEYKTAKKYGRFEELLSDKLSDDIRESLVAFPRSYLFVGRDGGPMSDGAYGEFVRKVFKDRVGKVASVNALRHMYISEMLAKGKMTTAKRKDLAHSMNHSVVLQAEYNVVDMVK